MPCFTRQAADLARLISDDVDTQAELMRKFLRVLTDIDLNSTAPAVAQRFHRMVMPILGEDRFKEIKDRFNHLALLAYPDLQRQVREAGNPLELAIRLAIAGNVIDIATRSNLAPEDLEHAIEDALSQELWGNPQALGDAVESSSKILYLADNAGEIVFDKLLIELLPKEKVTVAVRGRPILNDATLEDAAATGLGELVEVIDNGSDAPGTILEDCSPAFRKLFRQADLIIAKGQGNFETLQQVPKKIFFLLKVKCGVVAKELGVPVGTLALYQSQA